MTAAANLFPFRTGVKFKKTILSPAFGPVMLLSQHNLTSSKSDKLSLTSKQQKKVSSRLCKSRENGANSGVKEGETTATHRSVDEVITGRYKHRPHGATRHRPFCTLTVTTVDAALRSFVSPAYFPVRATTRNCEIFIGLGETHQRSLDYPSQSDR